MKPLNTIPLTRQQMKGETEMINGLLDPKVDFVFKNIFGSPHHPNILISFLNATLNPKSPIVSVEILNTELEQQYLDDKLSRLDVRATTNNKENINIEIQIKNEKNMIKRSLYYWSKLYQDQLSKGNRYSKLERTICINILNFNYLETNQFHTSYRLKEVDTHEELTDILEIHFIEVKKLNQTSEVFNLLEGWIQFLQDPSSQRVFELEQTIEEIHEAKNELIKLSNDKNQRLIYDARKKIILDQMSALHDAREDAKLELAKKLLDILDDETIAIKFDLDLTVIQSLRKSEDKTTS